MRPGDTRMIAPPAAAVDRIETAMRKARRGRLPGCIHLADVPVAVWCWQHPGRLWCPLCFAGIHVPTHTTVEEFGCDVCGDDLRTVDDLMLALTHRFDLDELVPIGRGRFAAVGPVIIGGWAECAECAEVG